MTSLTTTSPRPVFPAASLNFSELEAAMLAAPYGDEFAALVAEWQMRLAWEAALDTLAADEAALDTLGYDEARVVIGDDGLDHYL